MREFTKQRDLARKKHFPMKLVNGATANLVDYKTIREFARPNIPRFFTHNVEPAELVGNRMENVTSLLNHYAEGHLDNIIFSDKDGIRIGWHFGEQEDPSTYYMRNTAIFEEMQGKGLYKDFLGKMMDYVGDLGFERISSQHKPNNKRILVAKLKKDFVIQGMDLDDRHGMLIRLVYHVHENRRVQFNKMI